jgi:phage protein D
MVKTPFFIIKVNGQELDKIAYKSVSSITFNDKAGTESDKITIVTNKSFARPNRGDKIILMFGYEEEVDEPLFNAGTFFVQNSKRINNKNLTITATGVDYTKNLKVKKSETFTNMSIKDICELRANLHGLKVKSNFDIILPVVTQTNESDLAFFKRLAQDYSALFSIKNNTLIFVTHCLYAKVNEDLPVYKLDANSPNNLTVIHNDKEYYNSCEAIWHDSNTNKEKKITIGSGKPVLTYRHTFKNEADAKVKAEAKLCLSNRGLKSGSFSTEGGFIYAGANLDLSNTFDNEDDGIFSIKNVTHTYSKGWNISVNFEN